MIGMEDKFVLNENERNRAKRNCDLVLKRQRYDEAYQEGKFYEEQGFCIGDNNFWNQLSMGMIVEREHTDDNVMATKIALDHLTEFVDYYYALYDMEKMLEERNEYYFPEGIEMVGRLVVQDGELP